MHLTTDTQEMKITLYTLTKQLVSSKDTTVEMTYMVVEHLYLTLIVKKVLAVEL